MNIMQTTCEYISFHTHIHDLFLLIKIQFQDPFNVIRMTAPHALAASAPRPSAKSFGLNLVESFHCVLYYQGYAATKTGRHWRFHRQHQAFPGATVTRNRFLLSSISVVLVLLIVSGLVLWRERQRNQARVDQRFPVQGLKYCSSSPVTPCVVSFSQDADGNMLVSFLTDGAFYPDFYLKIKAGEEEHIYVCEKVNTFATSVYCTGKAMPVGVVLQFFIISLKEDVLLAQGNFPIIGIALAAPGIFAPPTPTTGPTAVFTSVTPEIPETPESTPSPSYPSYPGRQP
jgi:hypothetical protein